MIDDWSIPSWEAEEDSDDIREKVVEDRAVKARVKNEEIKLMKANALSQLCGVPKEEGEQWRIVTEKQFNAFALIDVLLRRAEIDEMYLAVYRINAPTVETLCEMLDNGRIKKAVFIISNFFNQTKRPEQWALMLRDYCLKNTDKTKHVYTHTHAKVLAVRQGEECFVFEGSGNMSDNARVEQYLYEKNRKTFEFHKSWMEELTKKSIL